MRTIAAIILFTLILPGHSNAQKRRSIEESIEILTRAMQSADEKVLNEMVSDQLSYGHSSGLVENKTTFVSNLVSGISDFITIDISDQTIATSGDKLAIVRHRLTAATKDRGKPGNVDLHVLQIWQKQKGRWMLVARQATKTGNRL